MSFGTWLYTLLKGNLVGVDQFRNRYYRTKGNKLNKRERRWVVYHGLSEASKVPPEWHAWLHHTVEGPLTEEAAKPFSWQKIHTPNLTGTLDACRLVDSDYEERQSAAAANDYEAWDPK